MTIRLIAPHQTEFILERSDITFENTGDPTIISVRQATQGDYERRNSLFSEWARVRQLDKPNEIRYVQSFSYEVVKRMEVFLALAACNILDESGDALFRFKNNRVDMSEQEFRVCWDKLPLLIADEVHEKVLQVNMTWQVEGEELSESDLMNSDALSKTISEASTNSEPESQ